MMDTEDIKQLKLTNFLSEDNILLFRGKQSKEDVLNALIDQLAKNPDMRPDNWYIVSEFLRKIELRTKLRERKLRSF